MDRNSIQDRIVQCKKNLSDETKLCFGAAIGCFVVGALGWLVNFVRPEATLLHGLLVVAGFYFSLGSVKFLKSSASEAGPMNDVRDIESNRSIGTASIGPDHMNSTA